MEITKKTFLLKIKKSIVKTDKQIDAHNNRYKVTGKDAIKKLKSCVI